MAEEIENKDVQEPSEEELKAQKKQALNYYKALTAELKIRADYEEQKMRIITYQRDALFAEIDIARIQHQQMQAEEEYKKQMENPDAKENEEGDKKVFKKLKKEE